MSKKQSKRNSRKKDLEEPLQDIELQVTNDQSKLSSDENNFDLNSVKENNSEKKISFCSRLFFLWTVKIMKLSNKGSLKKEIIRESPIFTSPKCKNEFHEDFLFIKRLWEGKIKTPGKIQKMES